MRGPGFVEDLCRHYAAPMGVASVYLSARFERRDELDGYRADLEAVGIEVTSRWLIDPTNPTPEVTDEAWGEVATKDVEDIRRADAFVLFSEQGRPGGGGRHVEFGVAVGLGKRVILVGEPENLFHRLDAVEAVPAWNDALDVVTA